MELDTLEELKVFDVVDDEGTLGCLGIFAAQTYRSDELPAEDLFRLVLEVTSTTVV